MTSSIEIASTLKLAIEREQDLAVNTGAFVTHAPGETESQFRQWASADRLFERFPELLGIGSVTMVPASALSRYAAQAEASGTTAGESFHVVPPGARPYYCFATLTESPGGGTTSPPNLDVCDTSLGPKFIEARDSGKSTYLPYGSGPTADLAVGTAVYRGGTVPPTLPLRRQAFLGWVGIQVAPRIVLARSLLRDPLNGPAVRARLHTRYQRLLLDEFQDTDPIQIELAVRIAAADPHEPSAGAQTWDAVPVAPGHLFVVGDPKQSIYRFRRADLLLYEEVKKDLQARGADVLFVPAIPPSNGSTACLPSSWPSPPMSTCRCHRSPNITGSTRYVRHRRSVHPYRCSGGRPMRWELPPTSCGRPRRRRSPLRSFEPSTRVGWSTTEPTAGGGHVWVT